MEFIQQEIPVPCAYPSTDLHSLASDDPLITPITIDWQKEKCALLDCPFEEPMDQHSSMAGGKIQAFAPWLCDSIGADGNCLFRCLSKVISGVMNIIRNHVVTWCLMGRTLLVGTSIRFCLPLLLNISVEHVCTTMATGVLTRS